MFPTQSVTELSDATARGERVVDVRERQEYAAGHVPGAEWIPLSLVPLRMDEFKGSSPVWVICESGSRSYQAAMFLAQRGIEVTNVQGGVSAWRAAGLPLQSGA